MTQESTDQRPLTLLFNKEAYTGIAGHLCRYRGDAATGIKIEVAPGDILAVTPAQIRQIFADLGAFNLLLEDPLGLRRSPDIVDSIKVAARARRDRRANRSNRQSRGDPFSHLICSRFAAWLNDHAVALWNRTISDQEAASIQAAFSGEGLLPFEMNRPGDFPVADVLTSLQALVGQRVIYEEARRFALVELSKIRSGPETPGQVYLTLSNLHAPGFSTEFPAEFSAGGNLEETRIDLGSVSGYLSTWKLITSPRAVQRICELAPGLDRVGLLKACRTVEFGE
jgi:hypothetical protein